MRWLISVAAAVGFGTFAQAQDMQKQFEAMAEKVTKAKAYQFDFEMSEIISVRGGVSGRTRGTVIVADGNRIKITATGTSTSSATKKGGTKSTTSNLRVVSNGISFQTEGFAPGIVPRIKAMLTPQTLCESFTSSLIHRGLHFAIESLGQIDEEGAPRLTAASFKLPKDKDSAIKNSVFFVSGLGLLELDSVKNLPIRTSRDGEHKTTVIFSQWQIDPKLAENTFAL